jgi:ABC-type transport system involved in multi-copper enzyme maturation permease subunit/ABC-type uncharacterized transport system involved in gliding motility auxiliary subunit
VTTLQKKPTPAPAPAASRAATAALRPYVIGAVFQRNFLGYFSNLAGYVFLALFVLVGSCVTFCLPAFFANNLASLDQLNTYMPYLLLFFIPAITMSAWAEERRQGTDELLLTLPARDVEVVLGKYLAALGIYSVALAFLAAAHLMIFPMVGWPDLGVMFATYIGYWLIGAMLIAVGLVASMLSSNVTAAFILGGLFAIVPVFLNLMATLLAAPAGWLLGPQGGERARRLIETLSVPGQFRDFGAGVVSLAGIVYFLSLAAGMLYVNMVLLGRRHWAGGQRSQGLWAHATVRIVALVLALASLDVLIGRRLDARVDASAERLNTLSPESRDLIRQIPKDRPVYIQAYYSPDVPREYVETKADLLNLLRECASIGGDRVQLNLVETERYSPEANEAEKRFGITAKRVVTTDEARQSSQEIYLGVAFTSGPEEVVIPFVDRGLPVEYELIRSLRVVSRSARKRVGILSTDAKLLGGMDFQSFSQNPEWQIVTELRKQYEVTTVSADEPIPTEEVQSVTVDGNPTGGTFTLSYDGEKTKPLPYNAEAKAVAEALEGVAKIGKGNVTVEGGPLPKSPLKVTFRGALARRDVPELVAAHQLTGGTKPHVTVSTTATILDALLVAQPSSLTQRGIDNLTTYVRNGGPALLLVDPMPVVDLSLAPGEPRRSPGGPFGGGPPPEPKGDLRPLLDMLGLGWPSDLVVWNSYNPTPQLADLPYEIVFVGRGGSPHPFGDDPASSGLQRPVVTLFPGLLRERSGSGLKFEPLLRTGDTGGTIPFDELTQRSFFGTVPKRARFHIPDRREFVLAARVRGKPAAEPNRPEGAATPPPPAAGAEVHAVVIADLDMISDQFFELRKRPSETLDFLDFDNVTFVLNCVDTLAGDDTFITLRKKRPKHRTLTAIEERAREYEKQAQDAGRKADDEAKKKLDEAQKRLDKKVEEVRERAKTEKMDEATLNTMVDNKQRVEQRRFEVEKRLIEDEKARKNEEYLAHKNQGIRAIQNGIRFWAIALPTLPVWVLCGLVFGVRAGRENRGASPNRLA